MGLIFRKNNERKEKPQVSEFEKVLKEIDNALTKKCMFGSGTYEGEAYENMFHQIVVRADISDEEFNTIVQHVNDSNASNVEKSLAIDGLNYGRRVYKENLKGQMGE